MRSTSNVSVLDFGDCGPPVPTPTEVLHSWSIAASITAPPPHHLCMKYSSMLTRQSNVSTRPGAHLEAFPCTAHVVSTTQSPGQGRTCALILGRLKISASTRDGP